MKSRSRFRLWSLLLLATGGMALAACGSSNYSTSSADSSVSSASSSQSSSEPSTPAHVHRWGDPTWEWHQEGETFHVHAVFTCLDDASHVEEVNATVTRESVTYATCETNGSATYVATVEHGGNTFSASQTITLPATQHEIETKWSFDNTKHWHACAHDATEHFDEAPHQLATRYVSNNDPTCASDGSRVEETYCTVCEAVISTKRSVLRAINHDYQLVEAECVAPTCLTGGKNVYECTMCHKTYTQSLSPLGHDFGNGPTCTEDAHCSHQGCTAVMPATGHNYQKVGEDQATCTQNGKEYYRCLNCNLQFENEIPATGHSLSGNWTFDHSEPVENETCKFKDIYVDECETCHDEVTKETIVTRHNIIAKIVKEPTCQEKGSKQYVCKDCGYVEKTEDIAINPEAHNWDKGHEDGNFMVYTCQNDGCGATKTSFVGDASAKVPAEDFAAAEEIKLEEAAFSFDDDAKSQLGDQNLEVKAEKKTAADYNLESEEIPADTPVFNFQLNNTQNDEKAEFDNGLVTVRVPHELQEGEDPEAIIVYYVNESGKLEEVEARYENGYAVFQTSHFSYYYVSYMKPAQACEKLGDRWGETIVVEPTCVSAGYSYEVCQRCGARSELHDVELPLGHDWQPGLGATEPTCTQPGHSDYECSRCHAEYGENLVPKGHDYKQTVEPATCTEPGKIVYTCDQCDEHETGHTYEVGLPAIGHDYVAKTKPSTCSQNGKIEYICTRCGDVDDSRTEELALVPHNYVVKSENDEQIVYECSMCGRELTVSKLSAPLSKDFNYTATAKSIAGTDLTIQASGVEFEYHVGDNRYYFQSNAAEGHLGSDASKKPVLYGNADYEIRNGKDLEYRTGGSAAAYLSNSRMYLLYDDGTVHNSLIDLNSVSMGSDMTLANVLDKFPELLTYLDQDVRPWLEKILDYNAEKINEKVFHLIQTFCDYKATPTGYEITLSFAKLATFFHKFKTDSIAACVDYVFGEGTLGELFDEADYYLSHSFYDALAHLKEKTGIDYQELIALYDKAIAIFTPYQTFRDYIYAVSGWSVDINEYLSESFLRGNSVNGLIKKANIWANLLGENTLSYYVKNTIRDMMNRNFFDLLEEEAGLSHNSLEKVQGYIDDYLTALQVKGNSLTLVMDSEGRYQSFRISLNLDAEHVTIKGNVEILFNKDYRSLFDYSKMADMGETVMDAIYQANFSTNEKIMAFFGPDALYTKDANGKIVAVQVVRSNSSGYYDPYSGKESYMQNITVQSEKDLFRYANLSGYARLHDLYESYKGKGTIILQPGDFYIYDIESFVPSNISYTLICGNRYEVTFTTPALHRSFYNTLKFVVRDAQNEVVYEEIIPSGNYSRYSTSYNSSRGTVNLVTKEFENTYISGHRFVLSEKDSEEEIAAKHCGDLIVVKYVCADCGEIRDESYLKGHTLELDAHEFLTDNHDCASGVVEHGVCVDCHEQVDEVYYEHKIVSQKEVTLEDGTKMLESSCYCGAVLNTSFPGYVKETAPRDIYFEEEGMICDALVYDSIENGTIVECWHPEYKGCQTQWYQIIYEGVTFDGEKGASFTKKNAFLRSVSEDHYALYIDLFSIQEVEGGYQYTERCANGDYSKVVTVANAQNGNSNNGNYGYKNGEQWIQARGYLRDLGYSQAYGYIAASGSLANLASHRLDDYDFSFEGCEFHDEKIAGDYWRYTCSVSSEEEPHTPCGFIYEIKSDQREDLGHCQVAYYNLFRIGVKGDGTAAYEFTTNYYTSTNHNYVETVGQRYATDIPHLYVDEVVRTCPGCDYTETSYRAYFDEEPLKEEVTEVRDGLTYVYPAGYYKDADFAPEYSWAEVRAYDAEGRMIRSYQNRLSVGAYYTSSNGKEIRYPTASLYRRVTVYGTYPDVYNTYEVSSQESNHHWYLNGNNHDYVSSYTYYYPYYEAETFARLFKQITGYDYDMNKYGCYRIRQNNDSDSLQLSEFHLEYTEAADYLCTQPVEMACAICGGAHYDTPKGHNYSYEYDSEAGSYHYVCSHCGQESPNWVEGSFSIELLDLDGDVVTIGYYDRNCGMGASLQTIQSRTGLQLDLYAVDQNGDVYRLELGDDGITDIGDGIHCKLTIDKATIANAFAKQGSISASDVQGFRFTAERRGYYYNLLFPATGILA